MSISFSLFVDFLASLAFIVVLTLGYSTLLRRGWRRDTVSVSLGVIFGLVAALEMYRPLTLTEGVIIDLRTIPVILAGAFLGWRGLLACLAVACSFRIGIGGIGAMVGVVGMTLAGFTALAWAHVTARSEKRQAIHLVALGVVTLTQMLAILLFPPEIRHLIVSTVVVPLITLNVLIVPAVAYLLDHQRLQIEEEKSLRTSARVDPDTGLLYRDAWQREMRAAHASGSVAGVLHVDLGKKDWLRAQYGTDGTNRLFNALRHRLKSELSHGEIAGQSASGQLLVPLTDAELSEAAGLATTLRRVVADQSFSLPDGRQTRLSISARLRPLDTVDAIAQAFDEVKTHPVPTKGAVRASAARGLPGREAVPASGMKSPAASLHEALFAEADRLSPR